MKSTGADNFTETKDCNGNVSSDYNGYWFAEKFIERANYCLQHNAEMRQQLSYKEKIKVKPINIQLELAGVLFHRNNKLLEYTNKVFANSITLSRVEDIIEPAIKDDAIHVFLYKGNWGAGIARIMGNVCVVQGVGDVYDSFIIEKNDWYFDGWIVRLSLHEIGHCLGLKHPKSSNDGMQCKSIDCYYDDDCDDTPTYRELILDGYKNPYKWDGSESSNNFMDYGASQTAWTPCQIEKVHESIAQRKYLYPNAFKTNESAITGSIKQGNKVVIAKNVTAKNVIVPKDKALYISCDEFQTSGEFEVKLGAQLEIK